MIVTANIYSHIYDVIRRIVETKKSVEEKKNKLDGVKSNLICKFLPARRSVLKYNTSVHNSFHLFYRILNNFKLHSLAIKLAYYTIRRLKGLFNTKNY